MKGRCDLDWSAMRAPRRLATAFVISACDALLFAPASLARSDSACHQTAVASLTQEGCAWRMLG
eukprot:1264599-Pleurochrysis_carterae.AAC.2